MSAEPALVSDIDVNEAAANAKKLALSTNSAAAAWASPFAFDFYSQIPPPNYYQGSQLGGGGGLNFMTGSNFAPPPIPQLSTPPPRPFARHPLSPRLPHPYQPPPPFYNNYARPPPNYSNGIGYNSKAPWNVDDEVVERVARNPEINNGPKPIRFSLTPGAGRKHLFNKPMMPNNSHAPGIQNGMVGASGGGGKPNSRFGPPLTPLDGTVKPLPDSYSLQIENGTIRNVSPPTKDLVGNYGLTNGSSWASASSTAAQGTASAGRNGTITNASSPSKASSLKNSADFAACINSDNWPTSLKNYAEKWFSAVMANDNGTTLMDKAQDLLREKLEEAYGAGNFNTKDWAKEPLPFFAPTQHGKPGYCVGPIPGTVKGTPLKVDTFSSFGRGRGRGRGGSRSSPVRSEGFKNRIQQGRPKGIRGRNRFKSRSSSRSRSRSRSSSSSSSSDNRSKKRRRSDSGSKRKKDDKKYAKKEKGKNKKQKGKKAHIYSEFGSIGGEVSGASSARLDARAARFAKDEGSGSKPTMKSRLGGFINNGNLSPVKWGIDRSPSKDKPYGRRALASWDMNSKIVGTSTDLEKMYLRLTTAPDPSTIRPVPILRKSLQMVCEKWKKTSDYRYACDQLKAIRQDLTVQRVREPFTVLVYETHARIALEKGDHEEFNQCQSQLVQLYTTLPNAREHQREFTAYRILYYIFTASTLDLGTVMTSLSESERQDECISHALQVRSAWAAGNYYQFFKLHKTAPEMSGYLIDWFVNRERKNALRKILKAYRPVVPKSFLQSQLDLTDDEGWKGFIQTSQLEAAIIYSDAPANTKINARDSHTALIAVFGS